jgi:motility quorum-sensing regulator/GCU-specific mRNA interferase toxin
MPHDKLAVGQALAIAGKVRITHAARSGASELRLTLSDMLNTVMAMTSADSPRARQLLSLQ